jgi:hypothetical protein
MLLSLAAGALSSIVLLRRVRAREADLRFPISDLATRYCTMIFFTNTRCPACIRSK